MKIKCIVCPNIFTQHNREKCCSLPCKMTYLGYGFQAKRIVNRSMRLTKNQTTVLRLINEGITTRKKLMYEMNKRSSDISNIINNLLSRKNVSLEDKKILCRIREERLK